MMMSTRILTCPTSRYLLESANVSSNNSALVTFSQAGCDSVQNVCSLHLIPNQTGVHPWQRQYPVTYPQGVPAVLGREESVQMITQRAREALNDQREKARRALLHPQGEILAATDQYEEVARQSLVKCRCKFGNSNIQQMRDFPKDKWKQIKLLNISSFFFWCNGK